MPPDEIFPIQMQILFGARFEIVKLVLSAAEH